MVFSLRQINPFAWIIIRYRFERGKKWTMHTGWMIQPDSTKVWISQRQPYKWDNICVTMNMIIIVERTIHSNFFFHRGIMKSFLFLQVFGPINFYMREIFDFGVMRNAWVKSRRLWKIIQKFISVTISWMFPLRTKHFSLEFSNKKKVLLLQVEKKLYDKCGFGFVIPL